MDEQDLLQELAWATGTAPTPTLADRAARSCATAYNLPAGGVIFMPGGDPITLTRDAAYKPSCAPKIAPAIIANGGGPSVTLGEETTDVDSSFLFDAFAESKFPQCYALAATTVIAYTLVIMLFITPRSFLDGGVVVLGRRGFTNGGTGTNIGGRPWLQKGAALTVAISLTIATVNTFRVAEEQYNNGIENARVLSESVLGGTELKVIRIISNTFLWLAQAQTLIRLFPRQREKVIIKWTAFALITLDVIFQSLNSFLFTDVGATRPRHFTDPVSALSYLFELTLGVLYAAWVIYYSLMKKEYAYYHPKMRNISLMAILSLVSLLVPIVFFILDISKPELFVWGDYVRWVGAAAASVIVWEWVERIEALEREEKKDGILGREVFDGDEMADLTLSDFSWPRKRKKGSDGDDSEHGRGRRGDLGGGIASGRGLTPTIGPIAAKYRIRSKVPGITNQNTTGSSGIRNDKIRSVQPPLWPTRPQPTLTPVSRTDTASAASTIYAIRFRPLTESSGATPPLYDDGPEPAQTDSTASIPPSDHGDVVPEATVSQTPGLDSAESKPASRWRSLARGVSMPHFGRQESRQSSENQAQTLQRPRRENETKTWDIKTRFEGFAMTQAERLRERVQPTLNTDSLPVTVIPAPARRGAALAQLDEEEQSDSEPQRPTEQLHRIASGALPAPTPPEEASSSSTTLIRRSTTNGSPAAPARRQEHRPDVIVIPAPPRRQSGAKSAAPRSPDLDASRPS